MSQRVKLTSSAFRVEDKLGQNSLQAFEQMFLGIYPREQLLGISPKKAVPRNFTQGNQFKFLGLQKIVGTKLMNLLIFILISAALTYCYTAHLANQQTIGLILFSTSRKLSLFFRCRQQARYWKSLNSEYFATTFKIVNLATTWKFEQSRC